MSIPTKIDLQETAKWINHALSLTKKPVVEKDGWLIIPGWGFDLHIQITKQGKIEGFVDGTDGG